MRVVKGRWDCLHVGHQVDVERVEYVGGFG